MKHDVATDYILSGWALFCVILFSPIWVPLFVSGWLLRRVGVDPQEWIK